MLNQSGFTGARDSEWQWHQLGGLGRMQLIYLIGIMMWHNWVTVRQFWQWTWHLEVTCSTSSLIHGRCHHSDRREWKGGSISTPAAPLSKCYVLKVFSQPYLFVRKMEADFLNLLVLFPTYSTNIFIALYSLTKLSLMNDSIISNFVSNVIMTSAENYYCHPVPCPLLLPLAVNNSGFSTKGVLDHFWHAHFLKIAVI